MNFGPELESDAHMSHITSRPTKVVPKRRKLAFSEWENQSRLESCEQKFGAFLRRNPLLRSAERASVASTASAAILRVGVATTQTALYLRGKELSCPNTLSKTSATSDWSVSSVGSPASLSEDALVVFGEIGRDDESEPLPSSTNSEFIPSLALARFLYRNQSANAQVSAGSKDQLGAKILGCRTEITTVVDRLFSTLASVLSESDKESFTLSDVSGRLVPSVAKALGARLGISYYAESDFAKGLGRELILAVEKNYLSRHSRYSIARDSWGNLLIRARPQRLPEDVLSKGLAPLVEKGRIVRPASLNPR